MSIAVVWSKDDCMYCTKAKDYLKKGGDVSAIKGKYDVSAAVEKELTS